MIKENDHVWIVDTKFIRILSKTCLVVGIPKNGYLQLEGGISVRKSYAFKTKKEALKCCINMHKNIIANSEMQIDILTKRMKEE